MELRPIPITPLPTNLLPLSLMCVIYWPTVSHFNMNYVYKSEAALDFGTRYSTLFKSLICIINIVSITGSLDNQQHNASSPDLRSLSISVVQTVPPEPSWHRPHDPTEHRGGEGACGHTTARHRPLPPDTVSGNSLESTDGSEKLSGCLPVFFK